MSQQFSDVRVGNTSRSTFDLSHHQVTTSDFGYLIPVCYRDMVPNDDFVVTPSAFVRLAPLAFPAYSRVKVNFHSFFVPYRILYPHWSEFITQSVANTTIPPYFTKLDINAVLTNSDPQFPDFDSSAPSIPGVTPFRGVCYRLFSNLGINPDLFSNNSGINPADRISAFPFLAYYRIWMDYFMDSNIYDHPSVEASFNYVIKDGGRINPLNIGSQFLYVRNCCYKKDYFTTAKLHPQAGSNPSSVTSSYDEALLNALSGTQTSSLLVGRDSSGNPIIRTSAAGSSNIPANFVSFTIEELRAANSLQRYLERNNYVGSKIINQILAHFGIAPNSVRLNMAEYLGGSSFPVQIGDVTSTTPVADGVLNTVGLGAQAGKGIGSGKTETVRYHATEHGCFITLMSIVPDTAYYQGLSRMFQKGVFGDAFDFYTPEFENLGYQEILNKEVYVPTDMNADHYQAYDPDGIFGYSPRYSEYKFQYDVLAGDFVGNLAQSAVMGSQMDAWHLFRKLFYDDDHPLRLDNSFVEIHNVRTDYDRIFQVTDNSLDHFYFNIDVDVKATRPMVGFAEPTICENNHEDGNSVNLPYGGTRL